MRRLLAAAATTALLALAGCSGGSGGAPRGDALPVYVSAPVSSEPWVGRFVTRGVELAVAEVNRAGGVEVGGRKRPLATTVLDNGGSAQTAVANARAAVAAGAVALVTDGVGAAAVGQVTDPARLPVFVVFEGGEDFIDPMVHRTLFRLAPANQPLSRRLADYLSEKRPTVALLTGDSSYGRDGRAAMLAAFRRNQTPVAADLQLPAGGSDVAPQVLQARRSGADHLVIWARAPVVAAVVRAARASGWDVPVYTSATGEDPLVRQRLADHPDWVDGLTFVSFRITSETGPAPFAAYRAAYEKRFGVERVGVEQDGKPVVMPPDWSMFSYDATRLVAAALAKAGATGGPLLDALESTVITGANGDERGYSPTDREGVVPDDMYFGRFRGFRFFPVDDDLLSGNLPPVPQ